MNPIIFVSREKINELGAASSCQLIPDNKPVPFVRVNGRDYVVTSYASSYKEGYIWVCGYRVIPINDYTGKVYTYDEHHSAVNLGTKERDYNGVIIYSKGRIRLVLTDPVDFKPNGQETTQLSLF